MTETALRPEAAVATRRMLIIWNPEAGDGTADDVDERRNALGTALVGAGVDAEIFESGSEAESEQRIARP